jgi:homoserine kinase
VLSGAGPSLLAVVTGDPAAPLAVGRAMEDALHAARIRGRAHALAVDVAGAAVMA